MLRIIALLAGLAALASGAGPASAASPAYCALYAKEFVKHAAVDSQGSVPTDHVHDRAYHKCLNMDEEPKLPTAYFDPAEEGIGGPFVADEGSTDTPAAEAAAEETPAEKPDPEVVATESDGLPVGTRATGKWRGSGYPQWSPEWRDWCAEHFPNSFDPETGTIVPYETGVRTMCE